jgi:hypothetical protein
MFKVFTKATRRKAKDLNNVRTHVD